MDKSHKGPEALHHTEKDLTFPYLETGYCCRLLDPFTNTLHSHDFYELIYCMTGSTTHIINEKKYEFPVDSVFILPPDSTHHFVDFSTATAVTICINANIFDAFLTAFTLKDKPCFQPNNEPFFLKLPASEKPYFHNLFGRIMAAKPLEKTPYLSLLVSRVLSCSIHQELDKYPIPNDFLRAISEMQKLENAREGISAFLRLANVSHSHLCRLSKQYLNMTPNEYITSIRLQYAHSIIIEESIGYDEIAEFVGFSSYPHFCKLFQKYYHISPSKLRQQNRL